jgi:Ca2+-binding EF-hand superfamily protein
MLFILKEDCPDGKLSLAKYSKTFKNQFPSATDAYCRSSFKAYDENKDGFIEFKEFIKVIAISRSKDWKKRLELAFYIYDLNHDGMIDHNEGEIILSVYLILFHWRKNLFLYATS